MAINNRHNFHAFSAFRCPNLCPATLGHHERRVDEAFFFIQRTSVAKLVSNIRQQPPQNLIAAPSLKAPMYRFVVGIALRQHMPLRQVLMTAQRSCDVAVLGGLSGLYAARLLTTAGRMYWFWRRRTVSAD